MELYANADVEVEKKLLSALMVDEGSAIPTVAEILQPDDFYRPEHRKIFRAMLNLSADGVAINVLAVEYELKRTGELKFVTHMYLFGLIELEYTTARATYYAGIVKRYAKLRRLAEIGRFLTDEATHADERRFDPEEVQAKLEERLTALNEGNTTDTADFAALTAEIFRRATQDGGERGLSSGFLDVDRITGGLKKTDLIILAARPSMGKTTFALNIAAHVAKESNVLFFSLEMGANQIAQRMLCATSRVDVTHVRDGNLDEDETFALLQGVEENSRLKLRVDDTSAISLGEVRRKARRMQAENGLDLIVIDYLQLMTASREYQGNRVQEVSELSRGLKSLAKDLNVPVLALSQLSRGVEMRAEKRPMLSDLRESGSIEQDADIVMFLYREEYYDKQTEKANVAEVNVAKNRNGETKKTSVHFEPKFLRFDNLVRTEVWHD